MGISTEELGDLLGKITPGEWKARKKLPCEDEIYGFDWYHYTEEYGVVGYWTGHKDNHKEERWCLTEYDAQLIALAPSLASRVIASENLVKALQDIRDLGQAQYFDMRDASAMTRLAVEALEKHESARES